MAEFHFVEYYQNYVRGLMASHPIDEAMSLAVGGSYERIGDIEADIVTYYGVKSGQSVLDLGCGSGRLAHALAKRVDIEYTGLDVVKELLEYATTKSPNNYKFKINQALTLPMGDASIDFAFAFSVFTHLLHTETFLYLEEMFRCLKPGGKVVCSFLEFAMASHWTVFEATIAAQKNSTKPHLNQFVERGQFQSWADHIGFVDVTFLSGDLAPWAAGEPLGQSIAVFRKPSA